MALGCNGSGSRAPMGAAVWLLPTPTAVATWRTPSGHMAWRQRNGRTRPCDLQVAVVLQATPHDWEDPAGRLLPTPDTGTSPAGHGRRGGRPGNGHQSGHDLDAVARALHPPPPGGQQAADRVGVDWGPYETAVRHWEHALGCPAPAPAEQVPGGRPRLAAEFAEWLMGIPGWVTHVPGISRGAQLRIIGNGVVPQQAAAALRLLAEMAAVPGAPPAPGTGMRATA
jgi:hypothetical protein